MLTCVIVADKSLMVISKLSQTRLIKHPASVGHKMLTLPSLYNLEIITYVRSCSDYFEIFIDSHNITIQGKIISLATFYIQPLPLREALIYGLKSV